MNEVDKFFESLPQKDGVRADIFEKETQTPGEGATASEQEENKQTGRQNRQERRREQRERQKDELIMTLADKVKDLSEKPATSSNPTASDSIPAEWIALYGDTPEAKKAWEVNKILIDRAKTEATETALAQFRSERDAEIQEQKKFEEVIDTELQSIEDEYDVDLTSNSPAARKTRREFLELVGELSPKDETGSITGYADFSKTFEIYQKNKPQEKNPIIDRQKEIASRSMTRSNSGSTANPDAPAGNITFDSARQAISRMLKG